MYANQVLLIYKTDRITLYIIHYRCAQGKNIIRNRIEVDFKSEEENYIFIKRVVITYRRSYGAALNVLILYY